MKDIKIILTKLIELQDPQMNRRNAAMWLTIDTIGFAVFLIGFLSGIGQVFHMPPFWKAWFVDSFSMNLATSFCFAGVGLAVVTINRLKLDRS